MNSIRTLQPFRKLTLNYSGVKTKMTTRLFRRFLLSLLSTLMLIHQAYGAVALTIGAGPNLGSYPLGTTQIPLNPSGGAVRMRGA